MAALPERLDRVRVEAAQRIRSLVTRGFYERKDQLEAGINRGFMVTPEEIEQRKGARVTDFLVGHHAIKVAMFQPPWPYNNVRPGLQPQGLNGCRMEIYVDGNRFYRSQWPPDPRIDRFLGDEYINDQIATSNIAAMEVYPRGVGAPPKYQPLNGTCGVILIWTK